MSDSDGNNYVQADTIDKCVALFKDSIDDSLSYLSTSDGYEPDYTKLTVRKRNYFKGTANEFIESGQEGFKPEDLEGVVEETIYSDFTTVRWYSSKIRY